jgi:hypothetical protein
MSVEIRMLERQFNRLFPFFLREIRPDILFVCCSVSNSNGTGSLGGIDNSDDDD